MTAKLTTKQFIIKARALHGDTYDYSKSKYVLARTPLKIICKEHGVFEQMPNNHLSGKGCPKCRGSRISEAKASNIKEFIRKARETHGNSYDYSKVEYHRSASPVTIGCKQHGDFELSPNMHIQRRGCPTCGRQKGDEARKLTAEEFNQRVFDAHGKWIRLVGQFRGTVRLHRFKCYHCLNTWKTSPLNVSNKGSGCPYCVKELRVRNLKKGAKFKTVTINGCEYKVQGYEDKALSWIFNRFPKLSPKDVLVETSGDVPQVSYKLGRRNRTYYPDIFIPKQNRIVEVKSLYTLGVTGRFWNKNRSKAKAVIAEGYKFTVLVMDSKGNRVRIPENWYDMTRPQLLAAIKVLAVDSA